MKNNLIMLFVLTIGVNLFASGFQINECGSRAMGMGNAFTAVADDPSAVFFNPAGTAYQEGTKLSMGITFIKPVVTFRGPSPDITEHKMKEMIFTPFNLYATHKFDEKWSAGLGINNPYGMASNWDSDWVGRYMTVESSLETVFSTMAVTYKIKDNLAISAGPVAAYGRVKIIKMKNLDPFDGEAEIEMAGDDIAWGFTAGILYKASEKVSFGISYRSKVDFKFEGEASSEAPAQFTGSLPDCDISAELTMPKNITFGMAYTPMPGWTLSTDFQYVGWSSYEEQVVKFDDPRFPAAAAAREYNNTYLIRFGTEYITTASIALRGGIFYDHSPVKDEYVEPSLPDTNRLGFNLGFGYEVISDLTLDMSYMYLRGEERKVSDSHESYTDGESSFDGVYNSFVNLLSLNVSYSF